MKGKKDWGVWLKEAPGSPPSVAKSKQNKIKSVALGPHSVDKIICCSSKFE
jgi:hypothetical protein